MMLLIGLYIAGVALFIAELFLPGGILGIIGFVSLIGATGLAFHEFGLEIGLYISMAEVLIGIIAVLMWLKYFPQSPIGKIFSLRKAPEQTSAPDNFEQLLGSTGKTISQLRPSGVAIINGERHDVVSEGSMIEKDKDIKVVKVEGIRIVVRSL